MWFFNTSEIVSTLQPNASIEEQMQSLTVDARRKEYSKRNQECKEALKRDLYQNAGVFPYVKS